MSHATLIIGDSGSGKTTSLRSLDPKNVLLIQSIKKPLPFRSPDWNPIGKDGQGSIYVTDQARDIVAAFKRAPQIGKEIVVVDDFQYTMSNEFMRRAGERGFDKFSEIAANAWNVLSAAIDAAPRLRIYLLSHSTSDEGPVRVKTIGKLLDEKITIEGMFSIVLRSVVRDGEYLFSTVNNGNDTVKTPIGLFDAPLIPNDLLEVDNAIFKYFELEGVVR